MKPGLPLSVVGHIVALTAGIIALPYAMETTSEVLPVIPIELVEIGEETNIRAAVEEEQPEPPPEEPALEEEVPEPPAQEQVTPAPPPPAPEPEPVAAEEPVPEEPDPEPEPEPEQERPPAPPAPPREEPEEFNLADIANLVDKAREQEPERRPTAGEAPPERAEEARRSVGLGSQMTVSEMDALRARITQCWRKSDDAPNPEELGVQVRVRLNRDGSLAGPPQVQNAARIAASGNPYLRIAADRAVRAVNECAPYSFLPQDRYSTWRELLLNFDSTIH